MAYRNNRRKNFRKNKRGKYQKGRSVPKRKRNVTARKPQYKLAMNRTTIIKKHSHVGIEEIRPFGDAASGLIQDQEWRLFLPMNLARGADNAQGDYHERQSSKIFARNTRFRCQVTPDSAFTEPFRLRLLAGYYKGDDNDGTQGTGIAPPYTGLKTLYPHVDSPLQVGHQGQRDFYFKYSRVFMFCPKMLYDGESSYPGTENDSKVTDALWIPRTINYNFIHNRIHEYESNEGDSLQGWTPFIAIQCSPLRGRNNFTRQDLEGNITPHGNRPGPILNCIMTSYFNDCK